MDAGPIIDVDVLIVGAGLSGIGAAARLRRDHPALSILILEARAAIGGTWDLFRYPGVRSDSDMFTLGYALRPWTGARAIASGEAIRRYIVESAAAEGVDRFVRLGVTVESADWDGAAARWLIAAHDADGASLRCTCRWLHLCAGYYDMARGHAPDLPGAAAFEGPIVHPQHWPDGLDWRGKRVTVVGSGATAVSLVPALAREAAMVTMVQRSPSWIVARPARDPVAGWLFRWLPGRVAAAIVRGRNVAVQLAFFTLARRRPRRVGRAILRQAAAMLPAGHPVDRDFQPRYDPWTQRLCLDMDGALFAAIRAGRVRIATGTIAEVGPRHVRMGDGETIGTDLLVTATGLEMKIAGGIAIRVGGRRVDPGGALIYRGLMFADVPNLSFVFGYTNASWTLKADLSARRLSRILRRMERRGARIACAAGDPTVCPRPLVDFNSTYLTRAHGRLPVLGDRGPWRLGANYLADLWAERTQPVEDGVLRLS